jgi:hypothetical protein
MIVVVFVGATWDRHYQQMLGLQLHSFSTMFVSIIVLLLVA